MKVLFLVPYPFGKAPSQRFRYEQYLPLLKNERISYSIQSFLDDETWKIFYKPGNGLRKIIGIVRGFLRRVKVLFSIQDYDFIFIHREVAPIGPPVFEWLIAKVFKKKIIYDFDDAIWRPQFEKGNILKNWLKNTDKVGKICGWSHKVSCGNDFLVAFARKHSRSVVLNPTTLDTTSHHNKLKNQHTSKVVIGWTGTHSTLCHLETKIQVIRELEKELDFEFQVISNQEPPFKLNSLTFVPWNKETEIQDLLNFNIGLMPLQADEWTKGKCGFKALQYMSLGIPAIVSPVGVNEKIVTNGVDGFICESDEEWKQAIKELSDNSSLRERMGRLAREKLIKYFSVQSNFKIFLSLFA